MGILDSVVGGAAGGLGSIAQAFLNWQSTRDTNAQNMAMTREQWGREDTAVQRRAQDMTAAGLNPVLAAGNPATSSPAARMEAPQVRGNVGADAMTSAAIAQNIAQTQAQTDLTKANARKAKAEAAMLEQDVPYAESTSMAKNQKVTSEAYLLAMKGGEASFENMLGYIKQEHVVEYERLLRYAQQEGLTGQRLKNKVTDLAAQLAEKDLNWYNFDKVAGVVSRGLGAAAKFAY